ncbi:hypothetical protein Tco_1518716, partial [Tanacetum coccineum]
MAARLRPDDLTGKGRRSSTRDSRDLVPHVDTPPDKGLLRLETHERGDSSSHGGSLSQQIGAIYFNDDTDDEIEEVSKKKDNGKAAANDEDL